MATHPVQSLEVSVEEAAARACPEHPLIDLRDERERQVGVPRGAQPLSTDEVLARCRRLGAAGDRGGFLICAEGVRSLQAARDLRAAGFTGYLSVAGGFKAWQAAALPTGYPEGINAEQAERYARHLVMPGVGPAGQHRLLRTRVLLVGLGGLNSPVALYLAAAGVGRLGLLDPDRVERSNLQRQVVHGEGSLGRNKARSAAARISDLNPEIQTFIIDDRVTEENAAKHVADWDIVIDGTDNYPARYALNAACLQHGVPLVYGAVMRFQGQVSVFWPGRPGAVCSPCFQCLEPQPPAPRDAPSCAEAGVLGVLPGLVGVLQAAEALKLALGTGRPLIGRLLMIDALGMDFREARIAARPECPACGIKAARN